MDTYFIAIDEDEVRSMLFFQEGGFATREDAEAYFATYDDAMKPYFHIYQVVIRTVDSSANGEEKA